MTSNFNITEPTTTFVVEVKETTSRWYEVMGVPTMNAAKKWVDEHGHYGFADVAVAEIDGSWDHHKTFKATAVEVRKWAPCLFNDRWMRSPPNKYGSGYTYFCDTVAEGTNKRTVCRLCEERLEAGYTLLPKEDGEE